MRYWETGGVTYEPDEDETVQKYIEDSNRRSQELADVVHGLVDDLVLQGVVAGEIYGPPKEPESLKILNDDPEYFRAGPITHEWRINWVDTMFATTVVGILGTAWWWCVMFLKGVIF